MLDRSGRPPVPEEWSITDVARASGLTSRALRHYEQIGLLHPSSLGSNGHRHYGEAQLSRLYRILSLRDLDLPLESIRLMLDEELSMEETMGAHLVELQRRRARTDAQITRVQHALESFRKGTGMDIDDVFAGADPTRFETEVRRRWGDDAWESGVCRHGSMAAERQRSEEERARDLTAALRDAATQGEDPAGPRLQALIALHHRWVADWWGGRDPDADAYRGLADLYVADERFSAVYGGPENAEVLRAAMHLWAREHLEVRG